MKLSRRMLPVFICAAAMLAGTVGYNAIAASRMAPPPVTVATIDIIKLVDKLNQKSDWDVNINAMVQRISKENDERTKAVEDLKKQLLTADAKELPALRDRLAKAQIDLNQWATLKLAEVDREKAFMWMDLYRAIRSESSKLAEAEGYDLILVNDGVTDLQLQRDSRVPQEQQAQEQIMRRRVLFASGSIDVTDKLILRMNNARNTAGTTPGSTSGSTSTAPPAPPAGSSNPTGTTPGSR